MSSDDRRQSDLKKLITATKVAIDDAKFRKNMAKALEMEVVVLSPRSRTFLNKIPCQDVEEIEQIQRRRILQMTFSKDPKHSVERLVSEFKESYKTKRRNRFNDLMLLSVWFEIRPKHFLYYVHHFIKFAAEEIEDDGNLLAKHLIAILRASQWHLMFQGLPLDGISKEFHMQYASKDGYGIRIAGTSAKAISNKFFKTIFNQSKEKKQMEFAEQNAMRLALGIICHCVSIDLFLERDDTYQRLGDTWEVMDGNDLMTEVKNHTQLADVYGDYDDVFKKVRRSVYNLQRDPVKTERKKFEKLKRMLMRIPDQVKTECGYEVGKFSDSRFDVVKMFCFSQEQRTHVDVIGEILRDPANMDDDDSLDLIWAHFQEIVTAVKARTMRTWIMIGNQEGEWFPALPEGIEDMNPIAIRRIFTKLLHTPKSGGK